MLVVLLIFALLWPPSMLAKADLLRIPTTFAIDWFFCFWLPIARYLPASGHLVFWLCLGVGLGSVPWWLRPRRQDRPEPSYDNINLCQGCDQCWQDCPFEAIRMVPRPEPKGRASERVAMVEATLCVSCGLCAGSCAPMAIGPPNRTGRMQLQAIQTWLPAQPRVSGKIMILVCGYNDLSHDAQLNERDDIVLLPTACSGSLHTSVIEQLLRYGATGVGLITCPLRNCVHREGPKWLFERVYNDREAELPRRVDRAKICVINGAMGERQGVLHALDAFCARVSPAAGATRTPRSQPQSAPYRASLLTHVRTFLPRLVVTVLFLVLLSVGNRTPVGHVGSDGVLRLAWRLPGAKIESCREVPPEELATKPLHMRQPRVCTVHPVSYRLQVALGGETRLEHTVVPAGARGDRPLYVHQDMWLTAGSYLLEVDFTPILPDPAKPDAAGDTSPPQLRRLTLHTRVTIVPNQITLIDYDEQAETLAVVEDE
jgi:ferredoxin/coenzyme F420-reducing hydrogenase delta subunit